MHLYLGQNPRTLYLITGAHEEKQGCPHRALIFRAAEIASQVVVEFLPGNEVGVANAVKITNRIVKGCLGLISVDNGAEFSSIRGGARAKYTPDIFLAVVTSATETGSIRRSQSMPERVAKIHEVQFYCLTSSTWDDFTGSQETLVTYYDSVDSVVTREHPQTPSPPAFEHPCMPLTKILSSGSFYYALEPYWDISSRLSVRLARGGSHDIGVFDDRFIWNEYVVRSLLDFREKLDPVERRDLDKCQFIVRYCSAVLYLSPTMHCRFLPFKDT